MNIKIFNGHNLLHELLLTTRQKTKLRNAFNNNMSTETDIKLSKDFRILGSLLSKLASLLMNVSVPFAKIVLAPLGITAAASAIDAGIQKKYMVLEQQL